MSNYMKEMLNRVVGFIYDNPGCGRRAVADELGLKVTPHLKDMIDVLVAENYIRQELDVSGVRPVWRFYPIKGV